MTQKQIIGLSLGVLGIGLIFAFVYRQLATTSVGEELLSMKNQQQSEGTVSEPAQKMPEPVTIDDVTLSIQSETAMDLSALDDEANGEIMEIQADSESITNLGTSYDENNL